MVHCKMAILLSMYLGVRLLLSTCVHNCVFTFYGFSSFALLSDVWLSYQLGGSE
jgi:hypothetical protein